MCWLCVDYGLTMCWRWVDYGLTVGRSYGWDGCLPWSLPGPLPQQHIDWMPAIRPTRQTTGRPPEWPTNWAIVWPTDSRPAHWHAHTHTRTHAHPRTNTHTHAHTHLQTSLGKKVVSLDGRNSRGLTNTKGTVEGVNIKTLANIAPLSKKYSAMALIMQYRAKRFLKISFNGVCCW